MTVTLDLPAVPEMLDSLEQALWDRGALAITLLDAADQPLLEPGPGELPLWSNIRLRALLPEEADTDGLIRTLVAEGLLESESLARVDSVPERDWSRAWLDRFRPMCFGERIWICPSTIEPDPDWPIVVRLDPGLAFGSGTHPTTAMCLEWLDRQDCAGRRVIDYGSGSGVLAVTAALCGADAVVAVDHDPQALTATADNAARNGVADRIQSVAPDGLTDGAGDFDLLLANILAGPLIALAPRLSTLLAPSGCMLLSGLLDEQVEDVLAAYASCGLDLTAHPQRKGWSCLQLKRR